MLSQPKQVIRPAFKTIFYNVWGLPWWLWRYSVCLQCRRPGFDPWVRKILWRKKWQPTAVLLSGKFHGWRSLVGYSPWGRKESDMTEWLQFHHLSNLQIKTLLTLWGFPCGSVVKNPPAMQEPQETWVQSLGREDPLEKSMAIQSSILAWRIPWTEEPGGLQSMGSQRVRHNWRNLACTHALIFIWTVVYNSYLRSLLSFLQYHQISLAFHDTTTNSMYSLCVYGVLAMGQALF